MKGAYCIEILNTTFKEQMNHMGEAKIAPKTATKEFQPKDAVLVFSVFSLVCLAVILGFIDKDLFTIRHFLSFANPLFHRNT